MRVTLLFALRNSIEAISRLEAVNKNNLTELSVSVRLAVINDWQH